MNPVGLLLVAAGIFSILGGALDWGFFMNSRKAQGMVRLMGHNGTRGFYVVLGLVIAMMGGLMTAGVIQDSN
jgi:hypothetical protein